MKINQKKFKVYDDKLDLLYEVSLDTGDETKDKRLKKLLNKCELFLNYEDTSYYRVKSYIPV
ncbi:MAG: hypothetical protein AAFX87_01245 [Bacteroidota bacterium]